MDEHPGRPDLDPRPLAAATACRTLWPLTVMPFVDPRSTMSMVLRARPADPDLGVAPGDAGVVDPQVGLGAAADDQARRLQRVARAVHLEHQRPRVCRLLGAGVRRTARPGPAHGLGSGGRVDPGDRLGGHREAPGRQRAGRGSRSIWIGPLKT